MQKVENNSKILIIDTNVNDKTILKIEKDNFYKEEAIKRLLNRLTCDKCGFITRKDAVTSNVCSECGGISVDL